MSKGSKNTRVKNWQKYWDEYDDIFRKKIDDKNEKCYICKSEPGKPTDFKQFCSRCGNQEQF